MIFLGIVYALAQPRENPIGSTLFLVGLWVFTNQIKDTYILMEDDHITLSRRFKSNDEKQLRVNVLDYQNIDQVAFGTEIKEARREQISNGRYGGYSAHEILFKSGDQYIPIDSMIYSKKNISKIVNHLSTSPNIEIYVSLEDYLSSSQERR